MIKSSELSSHFDFKGQKINAENITKLKSIVFTFHRSGPLPQKEKFQWHFLPQLPLLSPVAAGMIGLEKYPSRCIKIDHKRIIPTLSAKIVFD